MMELTKRFKKAGSILGVVGLLTLSSNLLADDGYHSKYASRFEPLPAISPIPANNSLTEAKVELGKMLFFEPRISASGVISCATCHNPALGWTDRIPLATGHAAQVGERNTPTVLNSGFFTAQFWDGRAADLEEQALGPIEANIEMNMSLDEAISRLKGFEEYQNAFARAYGGKGEEEITPKNVAQAMASFQRTLNTPNSTFDRYLRGDTSALTDQQKRGMALFSDSGCGACHSGPALTDSNFHVIKVPGSTDLGRFLITGEEAHKHAFKTPTLRNVAVTYPYFNNGRTATLGEAVQVMGKEMLGREYKESQVADIVSFLHSLTGEMPHIEIPALP